MNTFSPETSAPYYDLRWYADFDYLVLSSLNADRYLSSDADRFAEERAWYGRLESRTRPVHRVDGRGALALHHPTIEIRRLFCPES